MIQQNWEQFIDRDGPVNNLFQKFERMSEAD